MGDAYPELRKAKDKVVETLKAEEEKFAETLENGMKLFELGAKTEARVMGYIRDHFVRDFTSFDDGVFRKANEDVLVQAKQAGALGSVDEYVRKMVGEVEAHAAKAGKPARMYVVFYGASEKAPEELLDKISRGRDYDKVRVLYLKETSIPFDGRTAFTLYDTYGFPFDLTQDLCREKGIPVDVSAYDTAMQEQRSKARAASKFSMAAGLEYSGAKTEFHGYDATTLPAKVVALYREGAQVQALKSGEPGTVVLDRTPFYAESGGQVGDRGELVGSGGTFEVSDTQKIQAEVYGHEGTLKTGALKVGDKVEAKVDMALRTATMRNHSVTHLMHKALREVLGPHVQQKGSLVDEEKTRFDFAHDKPMSEAEVRRIEAEVNAEILRNSPTQAQIMPIEDAKRSGAVMLFGEKYGDEVRVLDIGGSREFCGGTHVARTGDIGLFKIVEQSSVAAGVRRVEAKTGEGALAWVQAQEARLRQAAAALKSPVDDVEAKIAQVLDNVKSLERELSKLKSKLASGQGTDLAGQAVSVKGMKVVAATLDGADAKTLREAVDRLKDQLKSAAIVLGAVADGKVALIAGVTADLTGKVKAGELVNFVAQQVGGKGGGRPDMAQAGGTEPAKLDAALRSVQAWIEQRV
jgi:alanyl-tRNA synthetase